MSARTLLKHAVVAALTAAPYILSAFARDSLQVTAIVGKNMKSTIECWTLTPDYVDVRGMKIQQLGNLAKATYTETPGDRDFEQQYTALNVQFFVILEGNATITFPTSDEVLHVQPNRVYVATDNAATSELGHITVIRAGSRILQLPFEGAVLPPHTAVAGECGSRVARDEL